MADDQRPVEYMVAWGESKATYLDTIADLEKDVRSAMSRGWLPLGGVAVAYDSEDGDIRLFQAMTRTEADIPWDDDDDD